MAAKLLVVLAFAAFISQGYAVTEIRLADQIHLEHLSNPFIPKTIGIAKSFLDKLVSCHIIFPNGVMYEAFPTNNLAHSEVRYMSAVEPFNSCSFAFTDAPASFSGIYELFSMVDHSDNRLTLTRQRHHLSFYQSDSWQVPQ